MIPKRSGPCASGQEEQAYAAPCAARIDAITLRELILMPTSLDVMPTCINKHSVSVCVRVCVGGGLRTFGDSKISTQKSGAESREAKADELKAERRKLAKRKLVIAHKTFGFRLSAFGSGFRVSCCALQVACGLRRARDKPRRTRR